MMMRRDVEELIIDAVKTNSELLYVITYQPDFIAGQYNTGFYEKHKEIIEK